tara:strand:+ start:2682 stop:3701 length:1020 start_codon:yes stop_codon:yes gene_type:complete
MDVIKNMEKALFFLVITISCLGFSNAGKAKNKINNVRNKLYKQKSEIDYLKIKFKNLKNSLDDNNKNFLKIQKKKAYIEASLSKLKNELDGNEKILKEKIVDVRKNFSSYILSELENNQDLEFLLKKRDSHIELKKKMEEINKDISFNINLKNEIKDLISKFGQYDKKQNDLISILVSLEKEKKEVKGKYRSILKKKSVLKIKLNQLKNKGSILLGKLTIPIKNYYKLKPKSKGINFFYKKEGVLLSPGKGRIIYSGKLSTYGDVIIIDHGHKVNTVLLGEFSNVLKKGNDVKKGQNIGLLKKSLKNSSLYFEVREKGKVKNVMAFLKNKNLKRKKKNI